MSERALATIRVIDAIDPIEGADAIEVATVGGWKVVVKKGEYKAGDQAVYLEIDSWVPHHVAEFLSKGQEPREYNGVKGERLKTVKLRGQVSQGLLLPLGVLPHSLGFGFAANEGEDVTHWLNIQKWERPMSPQMAGVARGNFPSFIQKTDEERIQNLTKYFDAYRDKYHWEISEKLEGSSMTSFHRMVEGEVDTGVCSRRINLKETEDNTFWQVARKYDLINKLTAHGLNIALQGELIGPGIEGNIYGLKDYEFRLYNVYDINTASYWSQDDRLALAKELDILTVPVIAYGVNLLDSLGISTVAQILQFAEGKSKLADVEREGLVFKCIEDPNISFKAISNKYLLKSGN
ncbi:MAG TPA: RNA ligase (ATP) [Methanosarcina sp.]|nr:RNA ligase (ATP) [Methanosarcina sp.]